MNTTPKMTLAGLTCIITLLSFTLQAQEKDKVLLAVRYSFSHAIDSTQRDFPMKMSYMLSIGAKLSYYCEYDYYMSDQGMPVKTTYTAGDGSLRTAISGGVWHAEGVVKNNSDQKILSLLAVGSNKYAVELPMPAIDWKISGEQKTIEGYPCQKATASFKGRNYTAWFTDQIPYRNGPWKLGGLPGLILEAYDDKRDVVFECKSVETQPAFGPILLPPDNVLKANPDELKRLREAVERDKAAMKGASASQPSATGATFSVKSVPMPGTEGRRPRELNNPVELKQ